MKLVHYAGQPVTAVHTVAQKRGLDGGAPGKPRGFWFSAEEEGGHGWREWCLAEAWGLERLTHVHDVELAPDAQILRVSSAEQIDALTDLYQRPLFPEHPSLSSLDGIDWALVALRWQGIVIAPYIWSRRLHMGSRWYYGWDCASGCIWDATAIAKVTLREVVPTPALVESSLDGASP